MSTETSRTQPTIKAVRDFLDKAQKLGKYPRNTGAAMTAALRVVEEGLTDDEPQSLEYLLDHIEEIFHRQLQRLKLTGGSLQTYISRVRRLLTDFQKYGQDSKAMLAWKPKIIQRTSRDRNGPTSSEGPLVFGEVTAGSQVIGSTRDSRLRTHVWALRPDLMIQIQLPTDLTKKDVNLLQKRLELEADLAPSP